MPTVFYKNGFRFFFFSNEGSEPPHIHIEKENALAKFWLVPTVELAKSSGFSSVEINKIRKLVEENADQLKNKWNEYFGR